MSRKWWKLRKYVKYDFYARWDLPSKSNHYEWTTFYNKCITRKCLTLRIMIKVTEYNIYNGAIRWRISNYANTIWHILTIAFTVSKMLTFTIGELENLGKGNRKFGILQFDGKYKPIKRSYVSNFIISDRIGQNRTASDQIGPHRTIYNKDVNQFITV